MKSNSVAGPSGKAEASQYGRDRSLSLYSIQQKIDAQDYAGAEAIVDQLLSDSRFGSVIWDYKADLLARRGQKADALDVWIAVLQGEHGIPSLADHSLKKPFDLAVELNRASDADELAIAILAHQSTRFGPYESMQIPAATPNSAERLAYAHLVMAIVSGTEIEKRLDITYCQKARDALPNNTLVLVFWAEAIHDRDQGSDMADCRSLLSQAWQQEPPGSERRSAIQELSTRHGFSPLP